jgi:hypothetical protein
MIPTRFLVATSLLASAGRLALLSGALALGAEAVLLACL